MANLVVPANMKRKDADLASHGFSIFLDPKRTKLQDAQILVVMDEEEQLADGDAPAVNVQPTMFMPTPVLPTQGQEDLNDCTLSTTLGRKCSEPAFSTDQAEPMDIEVDLQQCQALEQPQPGKHAPFFSGFF
ncbi:hypothetical protein QOZ80_8AG0622070 [Eleusine coracana subsp. coracana]|nr:hypothetical protein QOZ80_8AG0622070 [Eleusine coracana subsp. coracana]